MTPFLKGCDCVLLAHEINRVDLVENARGSHNWYASTTAPLHPLLHQAWKVHYWAHWKSHECPTRDLSISALGRYLCDENIMAPTIVWSLHAFLTLVHKSRPSTSFIYQHLCALYETPGCTYRLIHVVEGLVCLNKCSVLWQHLSKNLQSLGRKKILSKIMECQNIEWSSTRRELANILQ